MGTLRVLPVIDQPDPSGPVLLNLYAQLVSAARPGSLEFSVASGRVTRGVLAGRKELWLRYEMQRPSWRSYSSLLLQPDEARSRAVLLGYAGTWALDADGRPDIVRLPVQNPQEPPRPANPNDEYGVFVQGYAYDQVIAGMTWPKYIPDEATGTTRWLLLLLAFLLGAAPAAILRTWFAGNQDVFERADAHLTRVQRWRVWPWPSVTGPAIVVGIIAVLWPTSYVYPVAGVFSVCVVSGLAAGWAAWRSRRAALRFIRALGRADRARTARFGHDEIVRLPRAGLSILQVLLAGPVQDSAASGEFVRWLCFALVESDAGKTFYQRLPRSFFAGHGWLKRSPANAAEATRSPERADELTEAFIGTRLRRIRNAGVHVGLKPHVQGLARSAISSGERVEIKGTATHWLNLQIRLLDDCTDYLTKLSDWLESPATEAGQSATA
jgi:hypothetical protein